MHVTCVESTALARVAYDQARELLRLEFRSRAIYHYFAVPAAVHESLREAHSKGSYFNRAIRGRFSYCLVSESKVEVPQAARGAEDRR